MVRTSQFYLGCAVWAYKPWVGSFYPAGSRPAEFLHLYSRRLLAVEGNTTFYNIPDASTIARWVAETPAGFEFCLKVPKSITHDGALSPHLPAFNRFVELIQGLGDRGGPLFAQLPPDYSPAMLDDLTTFLRAVSRLPIELALEVRHRAWFQKPARQQLTAILTELGIGRVLLDSRTMYDATDNPQLASERKKPNVPLQPEVTAPFAIVRYISHPDLAFNQSYWQEWIPQLAAWLQQGVRIYFFVHCPLEERSPTNALALQELLCGQGLPVPALPLTTIAPTPTQLTLF